MIKPGIMGGPDSSRDPLVERLERENARLRSELEGALGLIPTETIKSQLRSIQKDRDFWCGEHDKQRDRLEAALAAIMDVDFSFDYYGKNERRWNQKHATIIALAHQRQEEEKKI